MKDWVGAFPLTTNIYDVTKDNLSEHLASFIRDVDTMAKVKSATFLDRLARRKASQALTMLSSCCKVRELSALIVQRTNVVDEMEKEVGHERQSFLRAVQFQALT